LTGWARPATVVGRGVEPGKVRRVKRSLICAGIIVALAIPAPTSAGVPDFEGRDRDGGTVSFETKVRHGRVKKVAIGFAWKNLYVSCHEGWSKTDGRFNRRENKAHGKIRVHGNFDAGATDCDTGKDHWRAHRVAA
jgi:hypothetical protein